MVVQLATNTGSNGITMCVQNQWAFLMVSNGLSEGGLTKTNRLTKSRHPMAIHKLDHQQMVNNVYIFNKKNINKLPTMIV